MKLGPGARERGFCLESALLLEVSSESVVVVVVVVVVAVKREIEDERCRRC